MTSRLEPGDDRPRVVGSRPGDPIDAQDRLFARPRDRCTSRRPRQDARPVDPRLLDHLGRRHAEGGRLAMPHRPSLSMRIATGS